VKLKREGVVLVGLHPEVYFYCGVADEIWRRELGEEFAVTNAFAGRNYLSFHTKGLAVDGRTMKWFDYGKWRHQRKLLEVVAMLRQRLDSRGFDVVLAPDDLTADNITKRFSDERLRALIGHSDRAKISDEQLEVLRRQIPPHCHGEFDPKPGEVLWPAVD